MSDFNQDPVLSVQGLTTTFASRRGDVSAVSDVSFSIARGERLAIVGESGSGKSTLALSLLKLLPQAGRISAGRVLLNGRDLMTMKEDDLRRVRGKDVGVVFQDPMTSLNPVIRVRDQMVPPIQRHLGLNRDAATARAVELLGQVGIPDPARRISAYPHELSGGMRQRVLIAMALSGGPDLVIADEPTTALDVTIQAQIVALLKNLAENSGTSVLFVTHDFGLVARFAHTIAVMYAGRIVEYGPAERVFHRPEHPYTRALLESIPAITGEKPDRLTQIEGTPPDLARLGSGCSFAPRCSRTAQICREHRPDLTLREAQHTAACWVTANSPVQGRSQADPFSKEREIVAVG